MQKGSLKQAGYMDLMLKGAQHTKGIIENVLDFTREKGHDLETAPVSESLKQAIYFATDILQSIATFEYIGFEQLDSVVKL